MNHLRMLLLTLVVWATGVVAAHATVLVMSSETGGAYAQTRDALQTELEKAGKPRSDIRYLGPGELQNGAVPESTRLVVTLGADALRAALGRAPGVPVLAALIPRNVYERILREAPGRPAPWVSAVYLDQPLGRQLDLLRLALPDAKKVGVLLSAESAGSLTTLQSVASSRRLQIVSAVVEDFGGLYPALRGVMETADVLLATADPRIYNTSSISNVLLSTYRAKVPLQAFSPSYVKAGALLGLYSSPEQIGQQAAEAVRTFLFSGSLPPPAFPTGFLVDVNEHVARSLGLRLDGDQLRERLQRMERLDRLERRP